jgi:hypothetical protein
MAIITKLSIVKLSNRTYNSPSLRVIELDNYKYLIPRL